MSLQRMKFPDHMDDIFDELSDLTALQRHTLKERYRFMMTEYRARCIWYAVLFYTFRITMTVGSLAVPALLSIQNTPGSSNVTYWFTWGLSLAVTTANGIMTLFKLDKRFFMLHATAERLRSETWQYIQLSGRYSGHHGHQHKKPTHENQFVFYCSQLEKINMKRIDEEYIKAGDEGKLPPPPIPGQKPASDSLVPSPPDMDSPESQDLRLRQSQSQGQRKESVSIVEDGEEEDNAKISHIALPMLSMQETISARDTLLSSASKL